MGVTYRNPDGGWPLAECNNCGEPIGDEKDFRWCDICEALVCPRCWTGIQRIDEADIKTCNRCCGREESRCAE